MSDLSDIGKGKLVDVSKVTGIPNFYLSSAVVKIGRSPANDFVIKEKTVSRIFRHLSSPCWLNL